MYLLIALLVHLRQVHPLGLFALLVHFLLWQAAGVERKQVHPLCLLVLLVRPLICDNLHGQTHGECRALTLCRLHVYFASEQRHNLARDGQSESHALLALCARQTCESVEHRLQFVGRHAASRVLHANAELSVCDVHADTYLALVGVFDGVAHEVIHNLFDAECVRSAEHRLRHLHISCQLQLLFHS